ncbi:MAG: hypothetical protein AABN34_10935 [Acidobacteriota bacterium]
MVTVEGIYKDGKVELSEPPPAISEARVLVTFLVPEDVDLRAIGISEEQAADLRVRFATFEDWNDPEMDIYNDYDAAKAALNLKV